MLIEEVLLFDEQNRCFFKALAWYNEAEIAGNRVKMLFFYASQMDDHVFPLKK